MTNDKISFELPDKADKKYAVISAVIYHLWNSEDKKETEKRINGFYKILDKMPNDFAAMMIKAAMMGNKKVKPTEAMQKIITNKNYIIAAKKMKLSVETAGKL